MLPFFIDVDQVPSNAVKGDYNNVVVVLSYVIAFIASYVAISILSRIDLRDKKSKLKGITIGAIVMGTGIWAMHFTGMLSYDLSMVHTYDPGITVLSMLIAVGFSWAVFYHITREHLSRLRIILNAPLMGIGIAGMHYIGMAAMKMRGEIHYIFTYFWISIIIAIVASGVAMWAMRHVHEVTKNKEGWQIAVALLMGIAVCGMHYTGMYATVLVPYADCRFDPLQAYTNMTMSIALVACLIIFLGLGSIKKQPA